MSRRVEQAVTVLSVGLFGLVLVLLHHELRAYHWHEVMAEVRAVPWHRLVLALGLAGVSYVVLTGYDVLALRWVGHPLPYRQTAFASFVAYVVSHNVGAAFLGGSAIRLRLYGAFGLSAADIGGVVVFTGLTFWVGFLPIAGTALLVDPLPASVAPAAVSRGVGVGLLLALVAYLVACTAVRRPLRWRGYALRLPTWRMGLAQMVLSCADWTAAAAVLWVLLPAGVAPSFVGLLDAFALAEVAGLVSHVPGGLGVFESSVLFLLGDAGAGPAVLASLVVYRVAYYLVPLAVGVVLLGIHEAWPYVGAARRRGSTLGGAASSLVPPALACATFMAGAVLLAGGVLPALPARLAALTGAVPLRLVEASHLGASVVGVLLMLVARGLQQRLDVAWRAGVALLAAGIVAALLRGVDWEIALGLAAVLGTLLACRENFPGHATLGAQAPTGRWLAALTCVVLGTGWLLVVATRDAPVLEAARAWRALVAAAVVLVVAGGLLVARAGADDAGRR